MVYVIMKNGAKIKTAKNLNSAKEIADKEEAEVFVNGKCVYPNPTIAEEAEAAIAEETFSTPEPAITEEGPEPNLTQETAEEIDGKEPEAVQAEEVPETTPYRLKALMNIREKPSVRSKKLGTAKSGTVVEVYEIKYDWMKIKWRDGFAFVLYQNGKFAEKND